MNIKNLQVKIMILFISTLFLSHCNISENPGNLTGVDSQESYLSGNLETPIIPTSEVGSQDPVDDGSNNLTSIPQPEIDLGKTSLPATPYITREPGITSSPEHIDNKSLPDTIICSSPPTVKTYRETINIIAEREIAFLDDETLMIQGWADRTEPTISSEATAEPIDPSKPFSAKVTYKTSIVDLETDKITYLDEEIAPLWPNPCPDSCYFEVITQSTNNKWQLVQIRDRDAWNELNGIWLVSQISQIQLVNRVPPTFHWYWSEDSEWLLFKYLGLEYGGETEIINLKDPPNVIYPSTSAEDPRQATFYYTVLSPSENILYSVASSDRVSDSHTNKLFAYDLNLNTSDPINVEHIPGLVKVELDETYKDILLVVYNEDSVDIKREFDQTIVTLLLNTFDTVLSNAKLVLENNIPFAQHALSPSGQRLAIMLGGDRIFIFDCEKNLE